MREAAAPGEDLLDRLAADGRVGLTREEIETLIADGDRSGAAVAQADAFSRAARALAERIPEAEMYRPREIL